MCVVVRAFSVGECNSGKGACILSKIYSLFVCSCFMQFLQQVWCGVSAVSLLADVKADWRSPDGVFRLWTGERAIDLTPYLTHTTHFHSHTHFLSHLHFNPRV